MNKLVEALGSFDTLNKIKRGNPYISDVGMADINRFLLLEVEEELPKAFLSDAVSKSGRFSVRVGKYMNDMHGIKLTPGQKQKIGNMADIYKVDGRPVIFDFTSEVMSWRRGSFGNKQSCYRGSYESSIHSIRAGTKHGKGFTIRLFAPGGSHYGAYRGVGRCWAMPVANNNIIIFNGYGETTAWFAGLLVEFMGGELKSRQVKIQSEQSDTLYVNKSSGYLLGENVSGKKTVSPRLDRQRKLVCHGCGDVSWYTDDNIPYSDGNNYCEQCTRICGVSSRKGYIVDMIKVLPGTVIGEKQVESYGEETWVHSKYLDKLLSCEQCGSVFGKTGACSCNDD